MTRIHTALLLALLSGCAGNQALARAGGEPDTGFPRTCAPGEVQVMLLGTYHMASPGQDGVQSRVDDVLSPEHQAELARLSRQLGSFAPDLVAVEMEMGDSATLRQWYGQYRAGTLAPSRNEIVQIGLRVAHDLGGVPVHPFDYPMRMWNDSVDALWKRRPEFQVRADSISAQAQRVSDAEAPSFLGMPIIQRLRLANSPPSLGRSEGWQWDIYLPAGEGDNYGGAQAIARWWERNIRMVHNLHRATTPATRRILAIVGSGHLVPLRDLLDASPQFCPVSALPYLR